MDKDANVEPKNQMNRIEKSPNFHTGSRAKYSVTKVGEPTKHWNFEILKRGFGSDFFRKCKDVGLVR